MGTFLIFLLALLICALLIGWWYRSHARRRRLPLLHAFSDAATRNLSDEERSAVENTSKVSAATSSCQLQAPVPRR